MRIRIAVLFLLATFTIWPAHASYAARTTFYPALFPAIDVRYASQLQREVNQGRHASLLDAHYVAMAFAARIGWPASRSGGIPQYRGAAALVALPRKGSPTVKLFVNLIRFGGSRKAYWSVIDAHTTNMRLVSPISGQVVRSPAAFSGMAQVFEGQFTAAILNTAWRPLGSKRATMPGMKLSAFSTQVTFRRQGQYGIAETYSLSAKDGTPLDVAMVKVMLAP